MKRRLAKRIWNNQCAYQPIDIAAARFALRKRARHNLKHIVCNHCDHPCVFTNNQQPKCPVCGRNPETGKHITNRRKQKGVTTIAGKT